MELRGNIKNPRVLIIGVFHGDEPQGEILIEKYLNTKKDSNILFVPRLNKNNKRVNTNGVDLNRNFPTKNWVLADKGDYFGGEFPASEKETKFLIEIIEKYNFKIILTIHAPYKVVNYDGPYNEVINKISKIMNYPIEESIGYPTPGSFGTWAGVERNISTITLELDEKCEINELEPNIFKVFEILERE